MPTSHMHAHPTQKDVPTGTHITCKKTCPPPTPRAQRCRARPYDKDALCKTPSTQPTPHAQRQTHPHTPCKKAVAENRADLGPRGVWGVGCGVWEVKQRETRQSWTRVGCGVWGVGGGRRSRGVCGALNRGRNEADLGPSGVPKRMMPPAVQRVRYIGSLREACTHARKHARTRRGLRGIGSLREVCTHARKHVHTQGCKTSGP